MSGKNEAPLKPRNGHTLVCGIVARISGCSGQTELSLDDQEAHGEEEASSLYNGPIEYRVVATIGKGEHIDRPELAQIEEQLRSREMDLVVIEDLGRLVRGSEAVRLLGVAVDGGTRVISPNDGIDTSDPNWEELALAACRDHVAHNAHTSKRIKQKLMNRFEKFGGAIAREIFGYIVPDNAKTYDLWQKDPMAENAILEGARRLKETLNCSAVADLFNSQAVPVGPYCRRKTWDGAMVRRFYNNPLLKGFPQRGAKHTVKKYGSGHRISVNNPKGPRFWQAPHLAYLDPSEFDDLNAALRAKNADVARAKDENGDDPLQNTPRKRTRFPGQHAHCWYCGRHYVWGGNGISGNLQCSGSREWHCWNSIGFDGANATKLLVEAITARISELDGFEEQFRSMVSNAASSLTGGLADQWAKQISDEKVLAQEKKHVQTAIARCGSFPMLQDQLTDLTNRDGELVRNRHRLESIQSRKLKLPATTGELTEMVLEEFSRLAIDSYEMGDLMRKLVPVFQVHLVRLCDGGHLLPRAKVTLNLGGQFSDVALVPGLKETLHAELALDLFEAPQRERIREEAVRLAGQHLTHRQIAQRIEEKPTSTAVGNAIALHKQMLAQALETPYVAVLLPPDDYPKLRRHRHSRYHFEPAAGYERPLV